MLPTAPREQAAALLARGETVQAERLVLSYVEDIKRRVGDTHPAHASALFLLSSVRLNFKDFDGAIASLREASAIPGTDHQSRRDQITYEWNLGMVLAGAGRLAEAEQALRANLSHRESFYGRKHAGYAFGLVHLAEVLWQLRRPDEALPLIQEAFTNLRGNNQQEQWEAAVLGGCIRSDLSTRIPDPFARVREATPEQMELAVSKMRALAQIRPVDEFLPSLLAFRDLLLAEPRFAAQAESAQILLVQSTRQTNHHAIRVAALQWLIARHPEASEIAVDVRVALANTLADMGDMPGELLAYDQACAVAKDVPGPIFANALRNAGLAYRDAGRLEEGLALIRRSLALSRERQQHVQIGRACIALGITLQHAKRMEEPLALLQEGVVLLPLLDPDMISGYSHIRSIEMGLTNCCEASGDYAIKRALLEFINKEVAPGLAQEVTLEGKNYAIKTTRAPTAEEQQLLDRILAHARAMIKR